VSPRTIDVSPRTIDVSPRTIDVSPRTIDVSPRTIDVSPRAKGERSPHKPESPLMGYNTGEPGPSPNRWRGVVALSVLLLVGWVLYELTAQPALGVAAVCIKFGWEDFRTAWWLRARDRLPGRGRACFWLYIASGLWKIAITASLMIFGYVFLKIAGALAAKRAAPHVVGSMLTAFGGIAMAAITASAAVVLALVGNHRLWLHHGVHRARRYDVWPPPHWPEHSSNLAGMLLGTTWFAVGVPVILFGVLLGVAVTLGPIRQPGAGLVVVLGFPGLCLAWALALYRTVRGRWGRRVFAATPADCWLAAPPAPNGAEPSYVGDEIEASRAARWGEPAASALEDRAQRLN
jgi:hypothetical protein